jgi:hypothetical protein
MSAQNVNVLSHVTGAQWGESETKGLWGKGQGSQKKLGQKRRSFDLLFSQLFCHLWGL